MTEDHVNLAPYELPFGVVIHKVHLATHESTAEFPGQICKSPYCPADGFQIATSDKIISARIDDQVSSGVMHLVCVQAAQRRREWLEQTRVTQAGTLEWGEPMPRDEAMAMCRDKRYAMKRTGDPGRGRSWHVALVDQ